MRLLVVEWNRWSMRCRLLDIRRVRRAEQSISGTCHTYKARYSNYFPGVIVPEERSINGDKEN